MFTTLEFELTEPKHENVSNNMVTARSFQKELMDAQQASVQDPWAHELLDGSPVLKTKVVIIVRDCSEKLESWKT